MEINGTNPLIVSKKGVQRPDAPKPAERTLKGNGEVTASDRLELSDRSLEIAHLNDLIQSTSDVRQSRIDQVRREIESGTYNVKADKIAEKLVEGNLLDEVF